MQRSFKHEIANVKVAMGTHQKETRTLIKNVEEEGAEAKNKVFKIMNHLDDLEKKLDSTKTQLINHVDQKMEATNKNLEMILEKIGNISREW